MTNTVKNSEKLQVTTPTARELVMTRAFDAPRSLVFDALTKPELLKRWYVARVTTVLVEQSGKTTFTSTLLFPSQEVRDMLIKAGMTSQAAETYDKLAEHLASVA